MIRRIKNILVILICSVFLGVLLLMLVFSFPVDSARRHVEESLYDMMDVLEDEAGSSLRKKILGEKDNFTDYLMVQNALEKVDGESALKQAMYVYHYDLSEGTTWETEKSLKAFLAEGIAGMSLKEYSKYWHGYLIWLKPMLLCMSWKGAESFLLAVQILLLGVVLLLSFRKREFLLGCGVLAAFLFMKPVGVWFSLTLSTCWSITLVAVLVDLLFYEKIEERNWREEYFLVIGIATSYLDFLTYPIVTLGIPLCFHLVRSADEGEKVWRRIQKLFWQVACWCGGYLGMWGMKWIVAELFLRAGTLKNALWSVIYRTAPLDGYGSVLTGNRRTIAAVLQQYDSPLYWIAFVVILAAAVVSILACWIKKRDRKESIQSWGITILFLCGIALLPFCWMVLTQNHTAIHCTFTFRIMGVSILALWSMTVHSLRTMRTEAVLEELAKGVLKEIA